VLDIVLDFRGEEIALYRGHTLWWLRGDDVDAQDASVWLCELNSYLYIQDSLVSLS
jgi:hypothetical protein